MSIASPAVKIKQRNVPFLTERTTVNAADIRGYMASIEGFLWGRTDGASAALRTRVDNIKTNAGVKFWLSDKDAPATAYTPYNVAGNNILLQLQQLDRIAMEIKEMAGNAYLCTPLLANVPKQLTRINAADRARLDAVILLFSDNSCDVNDTAIQTIVHLPPPDATYRIDRENLSGPPPPRYWTYRVQIGGGVMGGILMETDVEFCLPDVRNAFTNSLQSVPPLAPSQPRMANGNYIRLSAPAWLRGIIAA